MSDAAARAAASDPHLWLEDVDGARALDQVRAWNARTLDELEGDPRYAGLLADALAIVNAQDKIAHGAYRGGHVYNFWQDETNRRGLVRRTSLDSYLGDAPAWETLLDVDALAEAEGRNWVYKGSTCLGPDYQRCLLTLSDGGKDAAVRREWDHEAKAFVPGGFHLPEAKAGAAWLNRDTLLVATDWGDETVTQSGYPFVIKALTRGQSLDEARELFRGEHTDVGVWPVTLEVDETGADVKEAGEKRAGGRIALAARSLTFYDSHYFWLTDDRAPVRLPVPEKSSPAAYFRGHMLVSLQEDWTPDPDAPTHPSGALVSFDFDAWRATGKLGPVVSVYTPDERASVEGVSVTRSRVIVTVYENVVGKAYECWLEHGEWLRAPIALPDNGAVSVVSAYRDSDIALINQSSFIAPDTLFKVEVGRRSAGSDSGSAVINAQVTPAKSAPARFDASDLVVEQFEATSADGERIPYFVMRKKDAAMDGSNPTLLYGYGGFQVSLTPFYSGVQGKLWLERGGVFVLANIRGGGEFGPDWHQAGLKTKRQTVFNDFIAVGEALIASGLTSPRRLAVMGGSNGGLLVGAMTVQRPDLWNAVVCQVPLLDMLRYHTLLAGASWVGEYGDPDVAEEHAFLEAISPYHNVEPDTAYPEVFFVTSTKDDRVHPGHARKMAKRFEELGHGFYYYENIDGGHSASANLEEAARRAALEFTYLTRKLMDADTA